MGKFVKQDTAFGSYFCMYDHEGNLIGTSKVFAKPEQRDAAIECMRTFEDNSGSLDYLTETKRTYPRYNIVQDKVGEYRFRFCGDDGEQVILSSVYGSVEECQQALACVKAGAAEAEVVSE